MVTRPSTLLLLLLCSGLCPAQLANSDTSFAGTVVDSQGHPVQNGQVIGRRNYAAGGYTHVHGAETDVSGRFTIEQVGPVISFRKEGYRPVTLVLDHSVAAKVTLPNDAGSTWGLPDCGPLGSSQAAFLMGAGIRASMPRDVKLKHKSGTDTYADFITFKGDQSQQLSAWLGPGNYKPASPLFTAFPYEGWILGSATWSERTITSRGEVIGVEAAGVTPRGSPWRVITTRQGETYYPPVTRAAGTFFDGILNSACRMHN